MVFINCNNIFDNLNEKKEEEEEKVGWGWGMEGREGVTILSDSTTLEVRELMEYYTL